jgi:hypothetical protein
MNPRIPNVTELDLIRIRVIRRKHFEQILEPFDASLNQLSWQGIEFLAYVKEFDAMLARQLDNEHLRAVRVGSYICSMQNGQVDSDWQQATENARTFAHSLPQLFLD